MSRGISVMDLGPRARVQAWQQMAADREKREPRPSKYRAQRCEHDGLRFDSKAELSRWLALKTLESAGEIYALERQVRYALAVNGVRVCDYIADFRYREVATGAVVIEDVKGFRTKEYRLKAKLMKACHGIDIKEIAA